MFAMRVTPLVGAKVWFAPRRFGWGWRPVSGEGWVLTIAISGPVLMGFALSNPPNPTVELGALGLAAFALVVCTVKGTTPGGPRRAAEYERRTRFVGDRDEQLQARRSRIDEPPLRGVAQRLRRGRRR